MSRRVESRSFAEGDVVMGELPLDSRALMAIDWFFKFKLTATPTPTATGRHAAAIIGRMEANLSGKPIFDVTGENAYLLAACMSGKRAEEANGLTTGYIWSVIRQWITEPRARNLKRGLLDLTRQGSLQYKIAINTLAQLFSAGTVALTEGQLSAYYVEMLGEQGGDVVGTSREFDYVHDGALMEKDISEQGAAMRSLMAVSKTAALARDDTKMTTLGLRVGGINVLDDLAWDYARTLSSEDSGLDTTLLDDGVGFVDFGRDGRPVPDLGKAPRLRIQGTAAAVLETVRRSHIALEVFNAR